jgi:hypothetical protein
MMCRAARSAHHAFGRTSDEIRRYFYGGKSGLKASAASGLAEALFVGTASGVFTQKAALGTERERMQTPNHEGASGRTMNGARQSAGRIGTGAVGRAFGVEPYAAQSEEFSLVLGRPLFQLLLRSKLIRPPFGRLGSRIGVITALAWLPLVALTILSGRFAGGVPVPFLYDYEVNVRLLFSMPLLILAELVVYIRMRAIAAQFEERQITTGVMRPKFDAILCSAMGLRNSITAEIAILLLVFIVGPFIWRGALALKSDTWYATVTGSRPNYTAAGGWYTFVSVPVFQFILMRWYYRLFIWCRLLFQVSRLELNLVPLHPDRCCGLGFLGNMVFAFAPLLVAHSGLMAGFIANRILHEGAKLPGYKFEMVAMAAFLLLIVLGPLCVFAPNLNRARIAGLQIYGRLASDYVVAFAGKWSSGAAEQIEPLLGSSDIQSMADLDSSLAIVREMKLVSFGKDAVFAVYRDNRFTAGSARFHHVFVGGVAQKISPGCSVAGPDNLSLAPLLPRSSGRALDLGGVQKSRSERSLWPALHRVCRKLEFVAHPKSDVLNLQPDWALLRWPTRHASSTGMFRSRRWISIMREVRVV